MTKNLRKLEPQQKQRVLIKIIVVGGGHSGFITGYPPPKKQASIIWRLKYEQKVLKELQLARAVGVPVGWRLGGRLATPLVATINDIFFPGLHNMCPLPYLFIRGIQYLSCISGISHIYIRYISYLYQVYFKYISRISRADFLYISVFVIDKKSMIKNGVHRQSWVAILIFL